MMVITQHRYVTRDEHCAFAVDAGIDESETKARAGGNLLPLRLAGWAAVAVILAAALFGYVSLAGFLVSQVVWLTILGLVALLLFVFVEELLGVGLSSKGALGRRVREVTGLAANSLDQLSVLGSGLTRLVIIIALVMLALAPWGLDSSNLIGNLKAAFFGFQVGGVTISLSTIALAILFFVPGLGATRAVQNWLDTRYLPHTGLDIGLRNSIRTIFGYIGTIAAAMVALSHLGLSLDKLTLVAGALSVGIGFGLKSIVENFVSAKCAGVTKVLVADKAEFTHQLPENLSTFIAGFATSFTHVLAPATAFGKNLLPRVAALLDTQMISDVIEIISADTFKRPVYAGNAIATVQSSDGLKLLTVRTTAFDAASPSVGSARCRKYGYIICHRI